MVAVRLRGVLGFLCAGIVAANMMVAAPLVNTQAEAPIKEDVLIKNIESYLNEITCLSCSFVQFEGRELLVSPNAQTRIHEWREAAKNLQDTPQHKKTLRVRAQTGLLYMQRTKKDTYCVRLDFPATQQRFLIKKNLLCGYDLLARKKIATCNLMSTPVAFLFSGKFAFVPRFHKPSITWLEGGKLVAVDVKPKAPNTPGAILFFDLNSDGSILHLVGWQLLSLNGPPVFVHFDKKSMVVNDPQALPAKCFDLDLHSILTQP